MSMVLIATFLMAWTPYSVCVFVVTVNGHVPAGLLSFASVFAKSSTLYNPIIYSIFMKDFRDRCKRFFGGRVAHSSSTVRFQSGFQQSQESGGRVSMTSVSKTTAEAGYSNKAIMEEGTIPEEEDKPQM